MADLTARLLSKNFEEVLNDALIASAYLTPDDYQRWLEEDLLLIAAAIRELHARLRTAKAEGAAEAYEAEAREHDETVEAALASAWDWTGGYFQLRATEARDRAAAIRKGIAKERK